MTAKRKPLDADAFARAAVAQPDPVQTATEKRKAGQKSRTGKVQVQAWITKETRRKLKARVALDDQTVEEFLVGAILEHIK